MHSRNPVLLVHGIDDTAELFSTLSAYLKKQGWVTHGIDLIPNDGTHGLDVLAQQIAAYALDTFGPEQPFDVVGFSMGGIISRYYVQRLGGLERVQRLITLSSPHQGTWTAYLRWNAGAKQMRPRCPFLDDLNQDAMEQLGRINFTSFWTPLDTMIVPAESSYLPVGKAVPLPVAAHPWMVTDERVLQQVAIALQEPLGAEVRVDRQFEPVLLLQKWRRHGGRT